MITAGKITRLVPPHAPAVPSVMLQRKCACGGKAGAIGACKSCQDKELTGIQASLLVNQPGDHWEQEADRAANLAAQGRPVTAPITPVQQSDLQRSAICAETAAERTKITGSGMPLGAGLRGEMEALFGHDFGRVRVHAGPEAAKAADSVQARAFTHGSDIVFGAGHFIPGTSSGKRLLAHELTHTLQQASGSATRVAQRVCDPAALAAQTELVYFPMENSLRKVLAGKWVLKKGSTSYSAIGLIQQALVDMGYDLGTTGRNKDGVDKAFKQKTVDAIEDFQFVEMDMDNPTGEVDQATLKCLDNERAKVSVPIHQSGTMDKKQVQVVEESKSSGEKGKTASIYFAVGEDRVDLDDLLAILEATENPNLKQKALQLDGYISEQEQVGYGASLAKRRNENVREMLVIAGVDEKNIHTAEKPVAGKGQAFYRSMQKVEISEFGTATSTADCSKGAVKKRAFDTTEEPIVKETIDKAAAYLDKARTDAALDSKEGQAALTAYFGGVSQKKKVKKNLDIWYRHINQQVRKKKMRGTKCDPTCSSSFAYNNGTGSAAKMTLCEGFFEDKRIKKVYPNLDVRVGQALIIAHEAGHGSIGTDDLAYDTGRLIEFIQESPDLALKNTDSYIFLIRCLNQLSSACAPHKPSGDKASSMLAKEDEQNARRGIAWLDTWLTWVFQDAAGLYSNSVESRDKKKWTDDYYLTEILPIVEAVFDLHRPSQAIPTRGEQQLFAAITDRYRVMAHVTSKPLNFVQDADANAKTYWDKGTSTKTPGTTVTFAKDYFDLKNNRARVEHLLPLIVEATPIISAAMRTPYKEFVVETVKKTWNNKP